MSKVLTEEPAAPSAAFEQPDETPVPEGIQNFETRVEALSPKAREHWQLTGDLDAAEALEPSPGETAAPPPAPKKEKPPAASNGRGDRKDGPTAPASGPGTETEPQPKTPQERNFANLRKERERVERENIALKAKLEIYEREPAASRTPAPAATTETKPATPEKPKRPRYADFQTLDDYEKAMDTYEEKREHYSAQLLEAREQQQTERQSETKRNETWTEQVTTGKSKYKDFEAVAFSSEVPASFAAIPRLRARKDGAEIAYFLGKHPEEALRIAELTDIPGIVTAQDFLALRQKAQSDPQAARTLARAEALADAAFDQLSAQLGKPAASTKTTTRPLKPTSEVRVDANAKPVEDELADAIARGDQSAYERIMNRRDVDAKRSGGFSI